MSNRRLGLRGEGRGLGLDVTYQTETTTETEQRGRCDDMTSADPLL